MTDKSYGAQLPADLVDTVVDSGAQALYGVVRRRFLQQAKDDGLTQQALADRLGLPRAQVSRWLGSPSSLTHKAAIRLLLGMGRRLRWLDVDPTEDRAQVHHEQRLRMWIVRSEVHHFPVAAAGQQTDAFMINITPGFYQAHRSCITATRAEELVSQDRHDG